MKLSKKNAVVVRKALDGWVGEGALTAEQRQQLLQHVAVQPFDWRRLARYAFRRAGLAADRRHQPVRRQRTA